MPFFAAAKLPTKHHYLLSAKVACVGANTATLNNCRCHLSHLSKWPSDLKINGTQENITFSGPVFHGLSCGVFLFVASVSFKNHHLNGLNFSTANQVLLFYGF